MIEFLKRSRLGNRLYQLSRKSGFGRILRVLARVLQSEVMQTEHYTAANIEHNKRQNKTLSDFVNRRGIH